MGAVVLDTSVLLGLLDPRDAHHASAQQALRECRRIGARFVVPATVLAETLVGSIRVGGAAVRIAERFVDALVDDVRPVDRSVAIAAAELRAHHRALRLPDALVVATGVVLDADAIVTADAAWVRYDDRVSVIS